jgi:hypothetical protein
MPISLEMPRYFGHSCTCSHKLWSDVSSWLFIVRTLKWYQQSSIYAAWWLFCCPRITVLIFGNFRPISHNIPIYSGHIYRSSHYFWSDVSPWLFIVRTLKWYQQSSMYAAWRLYWFPRITILINGILRPLFLKFRAILVKFVQAVTNFGVMYHHDYS